MEKQLKKLRKLKLPVKAENDLIEVWTNWSDLYEKNETTLKQAYDKIKAELDKLEKKLNPVKKKAKTKKEKDEPEEVIEPVLHFLPLGIGKTYSETPMEFEVEHSIIDYVFKTPGGKSIGIIKTRNTPVGVCIAAGKADMIIDFDALLQMVNS